MSDRTADEEVLQNAHRAAQRALRAIVARIEGVWDDRDLMAFGGLTTSAEDDVLFIARHGLAGTADLTEFIGDDDFGCAHEWAYTGTEYGGDDESYHGEGRAYCRKCGADGDA